MLKDKMLKRLITQRFLFFLLGIGFRWSDGPQSACFSVLVSSWQTAEWRGALWRCVGPAQWLGLLPHSRPRRRGGNVSLLFFLSSSVFRPFFFKLTNDQHWLETEFTSGLEVNKILTRCISVRFGWLLSVIAGRRNCSLTTPHKRLMAIFLYFCI